MRPHRKRIRPCAFGIAAAKLKQVFSLSRFMPIPPATHLLVDGSNVVQAWADTRVLAKRDREAAKALLIRRVGVLRDFLGWRVTVVFDGRGKDLNIEAVGSAVDFACVHTPAGATADDVIEQLVARAAEPGACLVATADQAERATVEATGAAWCSPEELARRIDAVDTRKARAVSRGNAAAERDWRGGGAGQ
jgi:predicted RNA-binding protein with PIN domain